MQVQTCDTEPDTALAASEEQILSIGEVEPEPCQVLISDGADLNFLKDFKYIKECLAPAEHVLEDCQGCCCQRSCTDSLVTCSCHIECQKGLQALHQHGRPVGLVRLLECGPACPCASGCPARSTQQGVKVKLALRWDVQKGWGVQALQRIPQGTFVAEYVGEYVTGAEAERRLAVYDSQPRGHALLVVRVQLPSTLSCLTCCIDATRTGNVARFINHSCDGGQLEPVIISSRGSLLPRVALFAAQDISTAEELAFSYAASTSAAPASDHQAGPDADTPGQRVALTQPRLCHCGSIACSGFMPRVK